MKSRKEILIEMLHGSLHELENLPELIDQETIYDETGHVDCEFLTSILEWMSKAADISLNVQKSLNKLLGVEESKGVKKNATDDGEQWSAEEILKHCTLVDNVLKLPAVKFNKKKYAEAKKWIEEAGGSWQGGKIQGFTFPFNAERVFGILHAGKRCNLQQDYQFFATPNELADWLVMLAGGVHEEERVLEPSAGTGAIVDAIHRSCRDVVIDCFELMPENKEILAKKNNIRILGDDFTLYNIGETYDKIIANPPFSRNQDVRHVKVMYDLLAKGGVVAAIMSTHWLNALENECAVFRKWVDEVGGKVYEIEEKTFKGSGTVVDTIALVIKKN